MAGDKERGLKPTLTQLWTLMILGSEVGNSAESVSNAAHACCLPANSFQHLDHACHGAALAEADDLGHQAQEHAGMADQQANCRGFGVASLDGFVVIAFVERHQFFGEGPGGIASLAHAEVDDRRLRAAQVAVQPPQGRPDARQLLLHIPDQSRQQVVDAIEIAVE